MLLHSHRRWIENVFNILLSIVMALAQAQGMFLMTLNNDKTLFPHHMAMGRMHLAAHVHQITHVMSMLTVTASEPDMIVIHMILAAFVDLMTDMRNQVSTDTTVTRTCTIPTQSGRDQPLKWACMATCQNEKCMNEIAQSLRRIVNTPRVQLAILTNLRLTRHSFPTEAARSSTTTRPSSSWSTYSSARFD